MTSWSTSRSIGSHPLQIACGGANHGHRAIRNAPTTIPTVAHGFFDGQPCVDSLPLARNRAHFRVGIAIDHGFPTRSVRCDSCVGPVRLPEVTIPQYRRRLIG